jgi:hypothetical protein
MNTFMNIIINTLFIYIPMNVGSLKSLIDGIKMTEKSLQKTFLKHGVIKFGTYVFINVFYAYMYVYMLV